MATLGQLASIIGAELIGNPVTVVTRARPFESAQEGDVTFATQSAYLDRLSQSPASAIIVNSPVANCPANLLVFRNPKLAFAKALDFLHKQPYQPTGVAGDFVAGDGTTIGKSPSIHARVTVGRDSKIGDRVTLFPGVVLGSGCTIGDDAVIHANVTIYDRCRIGCRVIIHSGTVIGADGFGFVADEDGRQVKMLQLGGVVVEDDCEIGANCAIDRGGFGDTIIRRGVKLDNLIQVGHNCEIGEDTVVAALAGFSGGTRIGRRCVIAGQVGTNQHITIGEGATVTGQAGVTKSVRPGAVVGGTIPAFDYNLWRRCQALYSRLPQLSERLKRLEQTVKKG